MGHRGPAGLSTMQKAALWSRWKAGYSMKEIARALAVGHGSIRNVLLHNGGIVPAVHLRSPMALYRSRDFGPRTSVNAHITKSRILEPKFQRASLPRVFCDSLPRLR